MEKETKANKVYKNVRNIVLIAGSLALASWSLNKTFNNYSPFSEKDYKNARGYPSSVTPYEAYRNEDIPHNRAVWIDYQQAVKAKNGGSLENAKLFPDLDKDGKVAK